ncbi:MAG: hypothetical protein AB9856_20320 [Cellulosilyticaceae bacterium]
MKHLFKSTFLIALVMTLTSCSPMGHGKTEAIKNQAILSQINKTITDAIQYYFDVTIPPDVSFKYEAFKSFIPSEANKKEYTHNSNIFQAAVPGDAIQGEVSSYGGVLTPDNTAVTGLILNVFNEKVGPKLYTQEELEKIATDFLKNKQLVKPNEPIVLVGPNEKASSTYITVLNFDTADKRFAVGINLQFGTIVYFEHAPLDLFNKD